MLGMRIMSSQIASLILPATRSVGVQDLTETQFSGAINHRLGGHKKRYPFGTYNGECDVVVPPDVGERAWVETKLGHTYFSQTEPRRNNLSLLRKHLFDENAAMMNPSEKAKKI